MSVNSLETETLRVAPGGDGSFASRHLGSGESDMGVMLGALGVGTMGDLMDATVPPDIRMEEALDLPGALSEEEALGRMREMMGRNQVFRSFIGQGYSDCVTPPVIQRNLLENPGWYTAYTPYQAEIAQGRLEALLNYQTMVCDLTGMEVANASLLDEGTAAAEAMAMCAGMRPGGKRFLVSELCHAQTIDVLRTRAEPLGIEIVTGDHLGFEFGGDDVLGVLVQYPATNGVIFDYGMMAAEAKEAGVPVVAAADPLALTLLKSPGEWGADIVVGSAQRFGVPMGYGGPHAAFIGCRDVGKRKLPGRIVGVSHDAAGRPGYRLSLQTREQHIRRDKATSNICTAQVLLAVMAAMYASWHGPEGLKRIARRVHHLASLLGERLRQGGIEVSAEPFFDTLEISCSDAEQAKVREAALAAGMNLRYEGDGRIGISLDETTTAEDIDDLLGVFGLSPMEDGAATMEPWQSNLPEGLLREGELLPQKVFHLYQTETEMLRYLHRLESKDLALNESMIPLGSCTMKLNAAAEMMPLSWPEVAKLHPFAPADQAEGYAAMFSDLESWLAAATGFAAVSLQPNAGSQGEYAGLLAIRAYHRARGETGRDVCLIPTSAHGTNPASAVMAGFKVVAVGCDEEGNIDLDDLLAKVAEHRDTLGALMVTYPSTHGVFEEGIRNICEVVHQYGGQVYMDGANLNAQLGLCQPGGIGADVCHLNLHKTFCIPHGGGGPGVGPIGVAEHLAPYLPGHREVGERAEYVVCSAPWGSASILTISWMYISMMGGEGLRAATELAILNANYVAKRLEEYYPILFRGANGHVAHECIIDLRPFKDKAGIEVEDVAKRLMDYGYHAPTMSWPVPGTMMIEPTESESKAELDRFCDAMIGIHGEIRAITTGEADGGNNVLKRAPHTAEELLSDDWDRPYSRESAAFPTDATRRHKFWPAIGRIDNVYGDRHLVCTCDSVEAYAGDGR
ncbi:MAG: aminomethyl-transferring glycine dehydrogenase [Verrucomicrobiota bacterium]